MNTSAIVENRAASSWRAAWPFWAAVAIFLASSVLDSRRSWSSIAGLSPGSLATFFIISFGLLNVRIKPWSVSAVATALITLLLAWQVIFRGESLAMAYSLLGSIAMAWIIAMQNADTKFVLRLAKLALMLFAFLGGSFYLGIWRGDEGAMSFPNMNRNIVALSLAFGATLTVTLGRQGELGKTMKWAWPFAVVALVVPILFTASRKGVLAAGLLPVVYSVLVLPRLRFARFAFVVGLVALLGYAAMQENFLGSTAPVQRTVHRFEMGDSLRTNFAELAIDLIRREPLVGYGLSAPYDEVWLVSNGFVNEMTGDPLGVHSAILVYGLMGGLPLMGFFALFFGATLTSLAAFSGASPSHRNLAAGGAVLIVVMLVALAGGGAAESWKLGWFMVGLAMLIADVVRREAPA
jgi:hypothetical protein